MFNETNYAYGEEGDDIIYGGNGIDLIDGGTGEDTIAYSSQALVNLLTGRGGFGVTEGDTYRSIENIRGSIEPDTLVGNGVSNDIDGSFGADVIMGGAGGDFLHGGADFDLLDYSDSRVGIEISLVDGIGYFGTAEGDQVDGFESVTGSRHADRITGDAGDNIISGLDGADVMIGLAGSELYRVDDTSDRIIEAANAGTEEVAATVSYTLPANVETLFLGGPLFAAPPAINGTGNALGNAISGNNAANTLDGEGGADTLTGRRGDDRYIVDEASDQVIEDAGGGNDSVYARASFALADGQEIETLATISASRTTAIDLSGNDKTQTIMGNAGANILDGKGGSDVLYGLRGADSFAFSTTIGGSAVDRIADFSLADNDTIRLSRSIFSALETGSLRSAAFKDLSVARASVDADDRILYDHGRGRLYYDADGSGTGSAAVQFAILNNKAALTFQDFLVY